MCYSAILSLSSVSISTVSWNWWKGERLWSQGNPAPLSCTGPNCLRHHPLPQGFTKNPIQTRASGISLGLPTSLTQFSPFWESLQARKFGRRETICALWIKGSEVDFLCQYFFYSHEEMKNEFMMISVKSVHSQLCIYLFCTKNVSSMNSLWW